MRIRHAKQEMEPSTHHRRKPPEATTGGSRSEDHRKSALLTAALTVSSFPAGSFRPLPALVKGPGNAQTPFSSRDLA